MIKIKNLNKYFNRFKKNQNHVLNNINLDFPSQGLVVILGSSGSGKSSLLNVISGCDKFHSGTIEFNGKSISKRNKRIWNNIRNKEIGYVFQNYNLFNNLTVAENISLVLKMNGITSETEIKNKITYLLEIVGMKDFDNRVVDTLSGGQQQRIAFARAIVKNPSLIIADEPTGNLDSKTTIEIMNIFKKVSKDKLVIMVTHESELADIYADRIIKLQSGKIIDDYLNDNSNALALDQEQKIFLKDLNKTSIEDNQFSIRSYSSEDVNEATDIDIIKRNDTLYFKVNSEKYKRVKYLNDNSEIEIIDDHRANHIQNQDTKFDFAQLVNKSTKIQSVITIKEAFRITFSKLKKQTRATKSLYILLAALGAILAGSIGLIGKVYTYDENTILDKPRNYISIEMSKQFDINRGDIVTFDELLAFEEYDFVRGISLISEMQTFEIDTEIYYQTHKPVELDAFPVDINFLSQEKIIYGVLPDSNTHGVVIDKTLADQLISRYLSRGVDGYSEVLKCSLRLHTSKDYNSLESDANMNFNIVGIADDGSPSIWMKEELTYSLIMSNLVANELLDDGLTLTSGRMPERKNEVLIHEENILMKYGLPGSVGLASGQMEVVGTYLYEPNNDTFNTQHLFPTDLEIMQLNYFEINLRTAMSGKRFLLYVDDPQNAIDKLEALGIYAYSDYLEDLKVLDEKEALENVNFYIFAITGIVLTAVCVLFIMRSNLISMIKDISIYRLLGASNHDLRKLFIIDIVVVTTISSIIGYLLMIWLLINTQNSMRIKIEIINYGVTNVLIGIVALYLINLVFGLLPINFLLLKTPTQIQTKYDL